MDNRNQPKRITIALFASQNRAALLERERMTRRSRQLKLPSLSLFSADPGRKYYVLLDDDDETIIEFAPVSQGSRELDHTMVSPSETVDTSQKGKGDGNNVMAYPVFRESLLQSMNANLNLHQSPRKARKTSPTVCPIPSPAIVSTILSSSASKGEEVPVPTQSTTVTFKHQQPCRKGITNDSQSWTEDETSLDGTESTTTAHDPAKGVVFADEIGGQPLTTVHYYPCDGGATYHSHPIYERVAL